MRERRPGPRLRHRSRRSRRRAQGGPDPQDADSSRVVAVGQSLGGGIALAFAARRPAGLLGVVNVSGGVWRTNGNGGACDHADLVAAMATFGSRTRVPTLVALCRERQPVSPGTGRADARRLYASRRPGRVADVPAGPGRRPCLVHGLRRPGEMAAGTRCLPARQPHAGRKHRPRRPGHGTSRLAAGVRPVVEEYFSTPGPSFSS